MDIPEYVSKYCTERHSLNKLLFLSSVVPTSLDRWAIAFSEVTNAKVKILEVSDNFNTNPIITSGWFALQNELDGNAANTSLKFCGSIRKVIRYLSSLANVSAPIMIPCVATNELAHRVMFHIRRSCERIAAGSEVMAEMQTLSKILERFNCARFPLAA
jgi:hypothetical protein